MPASLELVTRRKPATLDEALDFISTVYRPIIGRQEIRINQALGRCLAADIVATTDLPRFDASAMDGFAVRSEDLASDGTANLRIVAEIAAGHPLGRGIGPGEAARIYTGAMMPAGADRVILQEDCLMVADRVSVFASSHGKPHIRRRGEDVVADQRVLAAGTRIGPEQIALLHTLQVSRVPVLNRLRVALLSSGDELQEGPTPLGPGRIIDSNRPMLRAFLQGLGCEVIDLGIFPDAPQALLQTLVDAAAGADLIITSGGASVGAADHLTRLIERRGYLEIWKLAMRPGKPVGLGDIDDCPILALPGNPLAAAVAFTLLGRPLIAGLSGDPAVDPPRMRLPLAVPVSKRTDRIEVLAGRITALESGETAVVPLDIQGSASLIALTGAEGLILLPDGVSSLSTRKLVEFVRL